MAELVLQASDDLVARLAHESDPVRAIVELIWNAIDGEAHAVTVRLERDPTLGAITSVVVDDDGHGISSDEVGELLGGSVIPGKTLRAHQERPARSARQTR